MTKKIANKLTYESVKDVIKDQLKTYNNESVEINDETKLNTILSPDDGFSTPQSSMNLFKGNIRWIIWVNGGEQVRFPSDWMKYSVADLAQLIMSKQPQE